MAFNRFTHLRLLLLWQLNWLCFQQLKTPHLSGTECLTTKGNTKKVAKLGYYAITTTASHLAPTGGQMTESLYFDTYTINKIPSLCGWVDLPVHVLSQLLGQIGQLYPSVSGKQQSHFHPSKATLHHPLSTTSMFMLFSQQIRDMTLLEASAWPPSHAIQRHVKSLSGNKPAFIHIPFFHD